MIITELVIEDYKQFAGRTVVRPDSQGIIAVFGANGAGKTTLFEAIEWCLYAPTRIRAADVLPRGRGGTPTVQITLEHPADGTRYVVRRRLKGRTVEAQVWREDQPGVYLATGAKPVQAYVAGSLIGLSHKAFEGTFFTRQKELTFFGDLKDTDRRRTVGRLLGLEIVRTAQIAIGEDAKQRSGRAAAQRQHIEALRADRDFAAEQDTAQAAADLAATDLERARAAHAATTARRQQADAAAEDAAVRERADHAARARVADADAALREHDVRVTGLEQRLRDLDEAARRRAELAPVAAALPDRRAAVADHVARSERFQRAAQLDREHARAVAVAAAAIDDAARRVRASQSAALPGWAWNPAAASSDPTALVAQLVAVAAAQDPDAARRRASDATALRALEAKRAGHVANLEKYHRVLAGLQRELADLLADGDPATLLRAAEDALRASDTRAAAIGQDQQREAAEAQRLRGIAARLHDLAGDAVCPTCTRPFTLDDADVIASFEANAAAHERRAATLAADLQRFAGERPAILSRRDRCAIAVAAVAKCGERIANGEQIIADETRELADTEAAIASDLTASGLAAVPDAAEVTRLEDAARAAAAIAEAGRHLATLLAGIERATAEATEAGAQRAALGEVAYDRAAHAAAESALEAATRAAAAVAEIDSRLAQRDAIEADRAASLTRGATLVTARDEAVAARVALAFDPAAVTAAETERRAAAAAERAAGEGVHHATAAVREARAAIDAIIRTRDEIANLERRAAADIRAADDFERMVKEFNEFERFVAARVTPQLAEHTSGLLEMVTGGTYDRVEFDDDYGLRVYDGPDEAFPIERFSGGERDVIALCARLALSQLIGASAINPPSFLVLDETFGALDRDRRAQLLELLASLPQQTASFQQLFIISHVEDVRSAPIFSQVWHVAENDTGASEVQDLGHGARVEDL